MSIRNGRLLGLGCLALGVALFGRAALLRMVDDGDADAFGDESNASDDSPDLRAIREAGRKIRPLHAKKTPTQPGEWLDKHPEFGQTFDAYRAEGPNRPTVRRTTLYLQPLGTFHLAEAIASSVLDGRPARPVLRCASQGARPDRPRRDPPRSRPADQ